MKISAVEEYGLRCMLQLARQPQERSLTLAELAELEGISLPYAGRLMTILRENDLVVSVRGRNGGYSLPRPAAEMTLKEILSPLGGFIQEDNFCNRLISRRDDCIHMHTECSIRSLWGVLESLMLDVLERITLGDLAGENFSCGTTNLSDSIENTQEKEVSSNE